MGCAPTAPALCISLITSFAGTEQPRFLTSANPTVQPLYCRHTEQQTKMTWFGWAIQGSPFRISGRDRLPPPWQSIRGEHAEMARGSASASCAHVRARRARGGLGEGARFATPNVSKRSHFPRRKIFFPEDTYLFGLPGHGDLLTFHPIAMNPMTFHLTARSHHRFTAEILNNR